MCPTVNMVVVGRLNSMGVHPTLLRWTNMLYVWFPVLGKRPFGGKYKIVLGLSAKANNILLSRITTWHLSLCIHIEFLVLTGIKLCSHSSTTEPASCTFVLELLVVIVEGIRSMVPHSVWEIARLVHLNLTAISTTLSTGPIQCDLQLGVRGLFVSYAPLLKLPI